MGRDKSGVCSFGVRKASQIGVGGEEEEDEKEEEEEEEVCAAWQRVSELAAAALPRMS